MYSWEISKGHPFLPIERHRQAPASNVVARGGGIFFNQLKPRQRQRGGEPRGSVAVLRGRDETIEGYGGSMNGGTTKIHAF